MPARVREYPWETTAAGPIEGWSDAVLTAVNLVLAAPLSMQVLIGPELVILYNDALIPQIDRKHPEALGQEFKTYWSDAWPLVGAQLEATLLRAETVHLHAVPIPLNLRGVLEQTYWDYSYSPIYELGGQIAGVLAIAQNVTEAVLAARLLAEAERTRREAEAVARRIQESLTMALDAANSVGIWDWDVKNDRVVASPRFALAYGVDPVRAASGAPIADFLHGIHADDRDRVARQIEQAMRSGEEYMSEYRLETDDGTVRWLSVHGRCSMDADGKPLRFAGVSIDITERRQIELALMQSEKLAAVGRLAASIAHEINNPLESVTNLLYLLRELTEGDARTYVNLAERELRRVSVITNQTLRFHKQLTRPTEVSCAELMDSALAIFHGKLVNSRIELQIEHRTERTIMCFEGEIRQVISNLIGNAIDATHGTGGRLLLRSREATDWPTLRRGLAMTVADTGTGMSQATARRVFEAFYTTKGIGGTGLGLWISKEIVERHGGRLHLRSSQREGHRGTVFVLFLPFPEVAATIEPQGATG